MDGPNLPEIEVGWSTSKSLIDSFRIGPNIFQPMRPVGQPVFNHVVLCQWSENMRATPELQELQTPG